MSKKIIHQFRVTLLETTPPVWRRVQVPADYSFWDLHVAIQDSMGWLDYHLHEFRIKKPTNRKVDIIGIPDTETDCSVIDGREVSISDYFINPGVTATYDYDFGDGWCHEVLLEGILLKESSVKYPLCVTGERACPPEDCGGTPGYERLLNVLAKPHTKECKDINTWLKGHAKNYFPYKPEYFDPREVKFWNPKKRWAIAFGNHA